MLNSDNIGEGRRKASSKIAVYSGSARLTAAEPERQNPMVEENAMLAKLKIVSPQLSEEEKREPMDDPKLGQNLKDRLDRIKKEFYANS